MNLLIVCSLGLGLALLGLLSSRAVRARIAHKQHSRGQHTAQPQSLGLRLVLNVDRSPLTLPQYTTEQAPHYLVIDTETAEPISPTLQGLPPHSYTLIALSWQILSERGACLAEECHLLRQEGCAIAPEATAIHGITTEQMLRGEAPEAVFARLRTALQSCKVLVAHNAAFHLGVLEGQMQQLKLETTPIHHLEKLCTMQWGLELGIRRGRMGERVYPSLVELFSYLHYGHLGAEVRYASKPLRDVRLLSACVRKMLRPPYRKHI